MTAANDQQSQYRELFERHELVESRQREMEGRLEAVPLEIGDTLLRWLTTWVAADT